MRKIKTKGLKIKLKPVDRGPRYALALQSAGQSVRRIKEALITHFEINDSFADVVLKSTPVVIAKDLDLGEATAFRDLLKNHGDFRVYLESAASRMKQMSLRPREAGGAPEDSDGARN